MYFRYFPGNWIDINSINGAARLKRVPRTLQSINNKRLIKKVKMKSYI